MSAPQAAQPGGAGTPGAAEPAGARTRSYAQALAEALREEMRRDPAVMLIGEDIGVWGGGGVFGVTRGLLDEFGSDRVRDSMCGHCRRAIA